MTPLLATSPGLNPVPGGVLGNGLLVAIIASLHVQIGAYLTGSSTLAIISEGISMARGDERHARLAHALVRSWAYVFSFGSALAIFFITFLLTTLWALFYVTLQTVTFWPFFIEALMFVAEVVFLYALYANWDRLQAHRRARLGLMVLLNIALWWQMVLIDVIASFMLTPNGGDANLLAQVLNPTDLPLTVHRTIGNIAWSGAAIAAFAAVRWLWAARRSRGDGAERAHWEWVAQWGVMWAVGLSLLQPWVGYSYAKEIQLHSYGAWFTMMFGNLSNVFLLQVFLLGMIFILGAVYFRQRMSRSGARGVPMMTVRLGLLVVLTLLAVQPAWFAATYADAYAHGGDNPWWAGGLMNPVGDFIPFKAAALVGMVVVGLWAVTAFLAALSRGQLREGTSSRRTFQVVVALGVTVSVMMVVMGVLREHSRQPYLVSGEITINGQQQLNTTPSLTGPRQSTP